MVESALAADSLEIGVDRTTDLLRWNILYLGFLPTRLLQNEHKDFWRELRQVLVAEPTQKASDHLDENILAPQVQLSGLGKDSEDPSRSNEAAEDRNSLGEFAE